MSGQLQVSYGLSRSLKDVSFEQALERVQAALGQEGFGVLTEIDVKATMKKKLDVDFRRYKILGACNPKLAHQALSEELMLGLLLPCNVTVFEEDDGSINVAAVKPSAMFTLVDNPKMAGLADAVEQKLIRAIDSL